MLKKYGKCRVGGKDEIGQYVPGYALLTEPGKPEEWWFHSFGGHAPVKLGPTPWGDEDIMYPFIEN